MIYIHYYPRMSYKTTRILNHFINTGFKDVLVVCNSQHYRDILHRFQDIVSQPLIKYYETRTTPSMFYDETPQYFQDKIEYLLEVFKSRVVNYAEQSIANQLQGIRYDNLIFDDLHPSYFSRCEKDINYQLDCLFCRSDIQIVSTKYGFEHFTLPHVIKHDTKIVGKNQYVSHGMSKFSL